MGALVQYFKKLKNGDIIDNVIINTLSSVKFEDPRITIGEWKKATSTVSTKYRYTYIPWFENNISFCTIDRTEDALSTKFNGCFMARYYDQLQYCWYIAHIHTGANDQRSNWNDFIVNDQHFIRWKIFRPNTQLFNNYQNRFPSNAFRLWGIITSDGRCYSLILEYKNGSYHFVEIKKAKNEICKTKRIPI